MLNEPVLILNQNYEPLNVCQVRRAIGMVLNGRAEVTENNSSVVRSASFSMISPSVVRLSHNVRRPRPKARLTRGGIFLRDHFTCQYCGKQTRELTLDHVVPRYVGGEHTWENVVSACKSCNQRKAGRTPRQANMRLLQKPFQPPVSNHNIVYPCHAPPEWHKYLGFSMQALPEAEDTDKSPSPLPSESEIGLS
ncbi:MAG: HNH endonuclease [Dehalococcoidia bacterium]|nr:HNH endonuclease [Dehalococcoidia bacterium]